MSTDGTEESRQTNAYPHTHKKKTGDNKNFRKWINGKKGGRLAPCNELGSNDSRKVYKNTGTEIVIGLCDKVPSSLVLSAQGVESINLIITE